MKRVLFLCSGNFYRSRFAEHLFNGLAGQVGLSWRADSRGLLVGHFGDLGRISPYAVDALKQHGIKLDANPRYPKPLTLADLASADLVVAVKEAEHRSLLAEQFPCWSYAVEYWRIDDLDCAGPEEALPLLEQAVRRLISRLLAEQKGLQAA